MVVFVVMLVLMDVVMLFDVKVGRVVLMLVLLQVLVAVVVLVLVVVDVALVLVPRVVPAVPVLQRE